MTATLVTYVWCHVNSKPQDLTLITVTEDQSWWGFTVKQGAIPSKKTVQPMRSQPPV